jgi:SpoU rRNA methylase family enzyme
MYTICDGAGKVVNHEKKAGQTLSLNEIQEALALHKPAVLFLCQVSQGKAVSVGHC